MNTVIVTGTQGVVGSRLLLELPQLVQRKPDSRVL